MVGRHAVTLLTSPRLWLPILILGFGLAHAVWGEIIPINNGQGWDGKAYAAWAKDFKGQILGAGVSEYYAQRIVPSAIVHAGLRATAQPLDDAHVVGGFQVYNLILLLIATVTWLLIARKLQFSPAGTWLGFFCLFVNYPILKNNFYDPVLTDTSAFTLGLLLFYFFLVEEWSGFLAIMVGGAFTWPTLVYEGLLLYLFPARPHVVPTPAVSAFVSKYHIPTVVALLATLLIVFAMENILFPQGYLAAPVSSNALNQIHPDSALIQLSLLGATYYLFFSLRGALNDSRLFDPGYLLRAVVWKRLAPLGLLLVTIKGILSTLGNGSSAGNTTDLLVHYTLLTALVEPLIFLVAHIVYYGPAVLLLLFFWPQICRLLLSYPLGVRLLVILGLVLGLNSESRFLINILPIFIVLLVQVVESLHWTFNKYVIWGGLALFASKVWYPINTAPLVYDGTYDVLRRFPLQGYFMNYGPWMSAQMYWVQGTAILGAALLVYWVFVRTPRRSARPQQQATLRTELDFPSP